MEEIRAPTARDYINAVAIMTWFVAIYPLMANCPGYDEALERIFSPKFVKYTRLYWKILLVVTIIAIISIPLRFGVMG